MQEKLRQRLLKQAMRVVPAVDGAQKMRDRLQRQADMPRERVDGAQIMRDRLARQEARAQLPKVVPERALDRILRKQQLEREQLPQILA